MTPLQQVAQKFRTLAEAMESTKGYVGGTRLWHHYEFLNYADQLDDEQNDIDLNLLYNRMRIANMIWKNIHQGKA